MKSVSRCAQSPARSARDLELLKVSASTAGSFTGFGSLDSMYLVHTLCVWPTCSSPGIQSTPRLTSEYTAFHSTKHKPSFTMKKPCFSTIRIISARKARPAERSMYEKRRKR